MEDMEELGQRIKQARLDRGITIDEVQKSTKIRRKYLKAIEEGDFEVISQEVFLKGFLRVYANYVGLDGQEILSEYNRLKKLHQEAKQDEPTVEREQDESTAEKVFCFISNHLLKIVAVGLLAAVLSGGALFYMNGIGGSLWQAEQSNQASTENKEVVLTEEESKQPASNQQENNTLQEQKNETNEEKIEVKTKDKEITETNVTIKVLETSWVKVVIDGKIVLEQMLGSGTEESWYANQNVKLLAANAAGVKVIFNGKTFGPFGKQGEVVEKKFAIKSN